MRSINDNIWKKISDKEYIEGLKKGNNHVTEAFFYGLCNYTLNDIRSSLMHNAVDYDELVSELYMYLSANNWHKLDTFAGLNSCTLRSWVVRITWRFFMKRREHLVGRVSVSTDEIQINDAIDNLNVEIALDVEATFARMTNATYVQVLKWMLVECYDAEEVALKLDKTVANVYNIKHRAIVQFVKVYNGK